MSIIKSKLSTGVSNRSVRDLSHFHHTTTDFGRIDPVAVFSTCPDDDFTINVRSFFRSAPLAAPTFGRITQDISFFYVPYRICSKTFDFDDWLVNYERYPSMTSAYGPAVINSYYLMQACALKIKDGVYTETNDDQGTKLELKRVFSALGYPKFITQAEYRYASSSSSYVLYDGEGKEVPMSSGSASWSSINKVSAYPLWAYYAVYMKYYSNDDSSFEYMTGGDQSSYLANFRSILLQTRYARFAPDPFTRSQSQPFASTGTTYGSNLQNGVPLAPSVVSAQSGAASSLGVDFINPDNNLVTSSGSSTKPVYTRNNDYVSGNGAVLGVDPMSIRWSQKLLRIFERYNVAGFRFVDRFLARFGYKLSSERMMVPQYLGTCRGVMEIGDITANTTTSGTEPSAPFEVDPATGTYSGQVSGKGMLSSNGTFKCHCDEYGLIIGVSVVRPVTGYFQGLDISLRAISQPEQLLLPEYDNLGFEPLKTSELYCTNLVSDDKVFGYVPRYTSYKWKRNTISGDYVNRDTSVGFESYHLNRIMSAAPTWMNFDVLNKLLRHQFDRIFVIPGSFAGLYDHFNGVYMFDVKVHGNCSTDILPMTPDDLGAKQVNTTLGGNTI